MARMMTIALSLLVGSFVLSQERALAKTSEGPGLRRALPQGEVKEPRQVRLEFRTPMVSFGDPRAQAPVQSPCLEKGQGRWIDPLNWVFDLENPLEGGRICELQWREGLRDLQGKSFPTDVKVRFQTGGPSLVKIFPATWEALDENQNLILVLDAEVNRTSVEKFAYFMVEGLGDRLPVRILSGSEEKQTLQAFAETSPWLAADFLKKEGGVWVKQKPSLVIKSERTFPPGAKLVLVWDKGIQSATGLATRAEQKFDFTVREDFRASFSCGREAAGEPCLPILPFVLQFTTPVSLKLARQIQLRDSSGRVLTPDFEGRSNEDSTSWVEFKGPFSPQSSWSLHLPRGLRDETGRVLQNESQFPLSIRTGENPPLLKFTAPFGIVELEKGKAQVPVHLRNVEARLPLHLRRERGPLTAELQRLSSRDFAALVARWRQILDNPDGEKSFLSPTEKKTRTQLPKPHPEKEFEVAPLNLPGPGFYFVEMESPRLGASLRADKKPYFVRTAVLATDLAVHMKFVGSEALIWVTSLSRGEPVPQADVRLMDCTGQELAKGRSDAQGLSRLRTQVALTNVKKCSPNSWQGEFFAVAEKAGDFSFVASTWDQGIETWRYRLPTAEEEPVFAQSLLNRNMLRPGETLSMKHILRRGSSAGFQLLSQKQVPKTLVIEHESGEPRLRLPLKWDLQAGVAESQWEIPSSAKLGRWALSLEGAGQELRSGYFRVDQIQIPLLRGTLKLPQEELINPKSVPLHLAVEYLAGGPAAGLQTQVRWTLEKGHFFAKDEELQDFQWMLGGLKEGLTRTSSSEENESDEESPRAKKIESTQVSLDAQGTGFVQIKGIASSDQVQVLKVEADYRDPNGENQSLFQSRRLWPTDRLLGVKAQSWATTQDRVGFEAVVLDLNEKPVAQAVVEIDLYKMEILSHRKRLVGGFYGYESFEQVKKIGRLCRGQTDLRGRLRCQGAIQAQGSVTAVARMLDSQGRRVETRNAQWVVQSEEQLWTGAMDSDRADLIPSKKNFEPGETAEFLLKTPFPASKVLVTVEREGILHSEVVQIDAKNPVIRLPIRDSWSPNVFVSALALRGRLAERPPTALVDLGKPSFRLGISEIQVGWRKHRLQVEVETDAKVYPVRGKVKARVRVKDADGKALKGGEVAFVAIDEGILQVLPNQSWNLLEKMMGRRSLLVRTTTAQTQVIGKRHYGLKAVPAGGDGALGRGGLSLRQNFDPLLLWRGRVRLDQKGEARLEFPLNDSLTSFRLVAVALDGRDRFGTGATSIRSSQDLMIFPGFPEVMRQGDELQAGAVVRNASTRPLKLQVEIQTSMLKAGASQQVELAPNESREVLWTIKADQGPPTRAVTLRVSEGPRVLDEIRKSIQVEPLWPIRVHQARLLRVENQTLSQPVQPLEGHEEGTDSLELQLASSLQQGQLESLRQEAKANDSICLEDRLARAVILSEDKAWKSLTAEMSSQLDEMGLLKDVPGATRGRLSLTVFALSLSEAAKLSLPKDLRDRLLEGVISVIEGRQTPPKRFGFADADLEKVAAFEALSRHGRFDPRWLTTLRTDPALWPTSSLIEWSELLSREAQIPERETRLREAIKLIESRFSFSGTRLMLSDEKVENLWWLGKNADGAAARWLLFVLRHQKADQDSGLFLRGFLERQKRGQWFGSPTQAWAALALNEFARTDNKQGSRVQLRARLEKEEKTWESSKAGQGLLTFGPPLKKGTLTLVSSGSGGSWVTLRQKAAIPTRQPLQSGFQISKKVMRLGAPGAGSSNVWKRGELVKIQIQLKAQSDSGMIVLEDPLPPGAVVLGSGLRNDSQLSAADSMSSLWTLFEERRPGRLRFYYDWVPQGEHIIEYTVRLNQAGQFDLPATRIESLHDPDLFGETPNSAWKIEVK